MKLTCKCTQGSLIDVLAVVYTLGWLCKRWKFINISIYMYQYTSASIYPPLGGINKVVFHKMSMYGYCFCISMYCLKVELHGWCRSAEIRETTNTASGDTSIKTRSPPRAKRKPCVTINPQVKVIYTSRSMSAFSLVQVYLLWQAVVDPRRRCTPTLPPAPNQATPSATPSLQHSTTTQVPHRAFKCKYMYAWINGML